MRIARMMAGVLLLVVAIPMVAAEDETPQTSPVSAYATPGYNGSAGFMSGRGLY